MEWELAARWRTDSTNTVAGFSDPWFTKGNSASGATADYNDAGASGAVAWYSANSASATHDVKGKTANSLGLSDMSGNVWEWSFDWHPSFIGSARVLRGSSWLIDAYYLQVGIVLNDYPHREDTNFGLRCTRTP
jgi:formylglycine-generating enzyme required for sulfatase activity